MKRILSITILAFIFNFQMNYAAIWYVTELGAGSMDGTSWSNAYPNISLQTAINSANVGDQVWVASGYYFTTAGTDRTIAFSMKFGVAIFGSFVGTETLLSQRNITCGVNSILSADIGIAANTDNSYKVVSNTTGLDSSAVLDGFVISGGYDERTPTLTEGLGGGILNDGSGLGNFCNPMIRNCIIRDNQAEFGAGIFNDGYNGGGAYPTIENCLIINNHATGGGGGVDNFGLLNGHAFPTIINTLIANNTAKDAAGGMYCWGGSNGEAGASLYNVTIVNNIVTSGNGGGIVIDNSNSGGGSGGTSGSAFIDMWNTILWGNVANNGPQFQNYGSGSVFGHYSNLDSINQSGSNALNGLSNDIIYTNPQFLNSGTPAGVDACWMTNDDGYQLQNTSPCINTGLVSTNTLFDLAFNNRVIGSNVDIGAYENLYSTTSIEEEVHFIQLFPNPVMDELNIITNQSGDLVLLNTLGEVIQKIEGNQSNYYQIEVIKLPAGIYYIQQEQSGATRKFIKL